MNPRVYVPETLDRPEVLFETLNKLGLTLPPTAKALAGSGVAGVGLAAAGVFFSEAKIDEALAKHELAPGDRMRLKMAIAHHRLMRR